MGRPEEKIQNNPTISKNDSAQPNNSKNTSNTISPPPNIPENVPDHGEKAFTEEDKESLSELNNLKNCEDKINYFEIQENKDSKIANITEVREMIRDCWEKVGADFIPEYRRVKEEEVQAAVPEEAEEKKDAESSERLIPDHFLKK